jgi:hypothetical protein
MTIGMGLTEMSQHIGMALMAAAATIGMLELPEHPNARVVVPSQPALVAVEATENNPLRREREEMAPHHISYSETQRTPGRTGKQ